MVGLVCLFHILCYDIWFYGSHILLHKTSWGWSIHSIHHEKRDPVWTDTYHGHWIESPFQSLGIALPWLLGCDIHPLELFLASLVCQLRGLARHDNRTAWLIGNHHILHHQLGYVNYGEYWIDCLCGTVDTSIEKRVVGYLRI
jgi:Delta7-sterol 5-desaturase